MTEKNDGMEPKTEETSSAFGDKSKDAGALWASLAAEIPAPAPKEQSAGQSCEQPGEQTGVPQKEGKAAKQKTPKAKKPSAGLFDGKSLGPVMPSVAMMKDGEGNLVATPPTVTSRIFSGLSLLPILLPLLLLLAQVALTLDTRALWYSDEVRYANAYQNMGTTADWLVLQLNGVTYPDKPPMFFWMLHGLKEVSAHIAPMLPFPVTENIIFFAGMAVSGIVCLFAASLLASMVGRMDRRTVLASNLILVGSFFFAGLLHYLRMDMLFAALITFSHVFLYHALVRDKAPFLMLLAFLFAGSAVLVKGPLGLAFPLVAGIFFLLWQRRITRIFRLDFIFGLIVGLAVPGTWLALAWMNAGDPFLNNILHKQVIARALNTWHHSEPWYHYLMTFPLIWLPWTLLLLFLPWGRFMGKGMREGLQASRTKSAAGIAYLWCAFLPGFILLSFVSIKIPIYCLPLFPPLAVLCARAILRMRPFAAACLQWSLAVLLALFGLALLLAPMVPEDMLPIPYIPAGTMILGGICLVFACMLAFLVKSRRGEGMVLLVALFTTVFAYPLWAVTAPSLDGFLSPKAQAEVLKTYKDAGYAVATYKIYPGTYTYYTGNVIDCESFEEALAVADKNRKTVLALRASFWDKLENKAAGFVEVSRQRIAERRYVIVARPALGQEAEQIPSGETPAEAPAQTPSTESPTGETPPAETPGPETPTVKETPGQDAPAAQTPAKAPAEMPGTIPMEVPPAFPAQ
jgi:4-amino-4-deoxy-L-arabinose transferase-like glycosyltransferase